MTPARARLLPFAALVAAACAPPPRAPGEDLGAIALATTRATFDALLHRDAVAFGDLLAADVVGRSPGEPDRDRAAMVAGVRALPAGILSVEGVGLEAHVYGDVAVVTGVQRTRARIDGRDVQDDEAFTDVVARRPGGYRIVLSYAAPVAAP